jgi:DNA-binding transcriptional ArsR family regulator
MGELNPLIHQPTRLRIMSALVSLDDGEQADFGFLRDLLELTDGNLSVHLQRLEEAGYLVVDKGYVGRRPKSWRPLPPTLTRWRRSCARRAAEKGVREWNRQSG